MPGTQAYRTDRTEHAVQQFHFIFHSVPDLPEALVQGKERLYISHFLTKITHNMGAFQPRDVDMYVAQYEQPGAMRCAFGVYRAFEQDAIENMEHIRSHGRCKIPTLILSGAVSRLRHPAEEMALEVTQQEVLQVKEISGASHYIAEENPDEFAAVLIEFLGGHDA